MYLLGFSKSISPKDDWESLTHDAYLRARTRIDDNGFSGNTYLNYFRCVIMNLYKSNYRQQKQHQFIDIENPDYQNLTEQILKMKEDQEDQEKQQEATNTYLTSNVYEYLNKYTTPKEQFIFKSYYLLHRHHINYKELSRITGYSITSVSNIIKRLKKELRSNLELYIRTGVNMEELLKEAQAIITNGGSWEQWLQIYKKIYGSDWHGCKCKKNKIEYEIKNWYNQNK